MRSIFTKKGTNQTSPSNSPTHLKCKRHCIKKTPIYQQKIAITCAVCYWSLAVFFCIRFCSALVMRHYEQIQSQRWPPRAQYSSCSWCGCSSLAAFQNTKRCTLSLPSRFLICCRKVFETLIQRSLRKWRRPAFCVGHSTRFKMSFMMTPLSSSPTRPYYK